MEMEGLVNVGGENIPLVLDTGQGMSWVLSSMCYAEVSNEGGNKIKM